ncbi:hypothetical protein [Paenibacillus tyrfis]|uniref:hypothetical protein n=1 Tax=Paenibacillus tyrfis TaxID=1501230 RepID=UPI00209D4053|nr:hypothetical protein [Paenibacillus tyrfis]MCP1312114.1 hypothetical protein [Paenibacillus tyrfis]
MSFDSYYPKRETGFERELSWEIPQVDYDFPNDFSGPIIVEPSGPIEDSRLSGIPEIPPHQNEIYAKELRAGDYFYVPWMSSIGALRATGWEESKVALSSRVIGTDENNEDHGIYENDRVIRVHRGKFSLDKPAEDMTNSEALEVVFRYIIEQTPGLKEAILQADKLNAIRIFKNTIKGGYGAFTKGLMFAAREDHGPDKTVELHIGKAGNLFPFKISNYRNLLGRYFYGDLSVPDVAPPEKQKTLSLYDPVRVTFVDGNIIDMKYFGHMGTQLWGKNEQGELLTFPQVDVAQVELIAGDMQAQEQESKGEQIQEVIEQSVKEIQTVEVIEQLTIDFDK